MSYIDQIPQRKEGAMAPASLTLTSPAFSEGGTIPKRYTADGDNVSPPLAWTDVPAGTRAFAILCEDPDAPSGTFVHWVAWNIDGRRQDLPEGIPALSDIVMEGVRQGKNDFGELGYGGPKPPPGKPHRYVFRLYALDQTLTVPPGAERHELESAMGPHVLGAGVLTGVYRR